MKFSEEQLLEGLSRSANRLYLSLALHLNFFPASEIESALENVQLIKELLTRRLDEVKHGNNRTSST